MTLKNKKKRNAIKARKNKSSLRKLASITTNTLSDVYSRYKTKLEKNKIKELQKDIERIQEENNSLDVKLTETIQEKNQLLQDHRQYKIEQDEIHNKHNNDVKKLQDEILTINEQHANEVSTLNDEIKDIMEKGKAGMEQQQEQQEQYDLLNEKHNALKDEMEEKERDHSSTIEELKKSNDLLVRNTNDEHVTKYNEDINELNVKIKQLEKKLHESENSSSSSEQEMIEKEKKIEELKEQIEGFIQSAESVAEEQSIKIRSIQEDANKKLLIATNEKNKEVRSTRDWENMKGRAVV